MAQVIYDDRYGARTSKVFGCSFKNITAQMGFNSQPIVFTVTVVEEEDQDFTLDETDIRSAQYVAYGELSILGIVQSWERTTTDPTGTGIYVVRLTDCRPVLDAANIANVYVDDPDSEVALIDTNVVYIGSEGDRENTDESSRQEEAGVPFSTIISRVEATTLHYGNNAFTVNMDALKDLTNWRNEGTDDYYIEGEIRSLVSTITEFCNAVGAEWWVESQRTSVVDDTIVITIKVIRRLDSIGNPTAIDLDSLASLHNNEVIRRKDGYENQDTTTNKVIWGGVRRKLEQVSNVEIKPFWGFDEFGLPLSSPSYVMPNEPQYRRVDTSIAEMENVLNNYLVNEVDAEQLAALQRYMDDFWGKRFYFELRKNTLSDTGTNLQDYPEIIPAGWWEEDIPPNGARQFDPDALLKLTTEDGRWGSFVHLSDIFITGSGTEESPKKVHPVTWANTVYNSNNLIPRENDNYMKCTLEQYGKYVIMVMPVSLSRYYIDPITGEPDANKLTRHEELSKSWIPIMDRTIHYGPWSNTSLVRSRIPVPGNSEVSVDKDLVPWTFGTRDLTNQQAMDQLTELAATQIDTLPELAIINTGQLEVAGTPKVNIGQAIGNGSSITEIFIRFDNNGVTTRYVVNLYTKELGEFKRKQQREREQQQEEDEKVLEDDFPENKDDFESPPEPETLPDDEDLAGPSQPQREYVYEKPEGGLGIVTTKEGGPFYAVRRLSYRDVDPETFAGAGVVFDSYFLSEWTNVRNLSEPELSPGWIPVGTKVTISIFSETDESGPYLPYMEQTPPTFAPPIT